MMVKGKFWITFRECAKFLVTQAGFTDREADIFLGRKKRDSHTAGWERVFVYALSSLKYTKVHQKLI